MCRIHHRRCYYEGAQPVYNSAEDELVRMLMTDRAQNVDVGTRLNSPFAPAPTPPSAAFVALPRPLVSVVRPLAEPQPSAAANVGLRRPRSRIIDFDFDSSSDDAPPRPVLHRRSSGSLDDALLRLYSSRARFRPFALPPHSVQHLRPPRSPFTYYSHFDPSLFLPL